MHAVAVSTGLALAAIGALHLVWAVSPWPLPTRADLARTVVGRPDGDLPRAFFVPATIAVWVALSAAGYLVAVEGEVLRRALPGTLVALGTWGVAAVLLGRGAMGFVQSGFGLSNTPASYRRLDLVLYSPLCVLLGSLAILVALS